jgi:hypothetical protein
MKLLKTMDTIYLIVHINKLASKDVLQQGVDYENS